jgi:hypothetical protein
MTESCETCDEKGLGPLGIIGLGQFLMDHQINLGIDIKGRENQIGSRGKQAMEIAH